MVNSIWFQNGQTLQILNLSCCEGLDLESIQYIIKHCVDLTEVTFDKISRKHNFDPELISDRDILPEEAISYLTKNLTRFST